MTDRVRETEGEVGTAVRGMYAGLGDPARFDRYLHPDITIWESDQPGPRIGLAELTALRQRRAGGSSSALPRLRIEDLLVDRWGEVAAVGRYVLVAETEDGSEAFRVTDVWHLDGEGWRIVHHHAEAVPADEWMGQDGPRDDAAVRTTGTEDDAHAG